MLFEVVISTVFTICILLSGTTLFVKNREYALLNGPVVAGPMDSFGKFLIAVARSSYS